MHKPSEIFPIVFNQENKKQLFIDATIHALAEYGYGKTSVRKIAKIANVSPGLLTHYYEGKEVLVAESYKYLAGKFLSLFKQRIEQHLDDPVKALKSFFEATFEPHNLDPKLLRVWLSFWSLTLTQPDLVHIHQNSYRQYIISIEDILTRAFTAQGLRHTPQKIRHLAIGINAMLDGMWLEWCLDSETFTPEEGLEIIYDFVNACTGLNIKDGQT